MSTRLTDNAIASFDDRVKHAYPADEPPIPGDFAGSGVVIPTPGPDPDPPETVVVPNVVGQTQAAATTLITNAQLFLGNVTFQSSATVAAGLVIAQNPAAGLTVDINTSVSIFVSTGPSAGGGDALLLPDGSSFLLLPDGTSKLLLP